MYKAKNKKVLGLIKDGLGGEIMKEIAALRAKTYSYLTDNSTEENKAKGTKNSVVKNISIWRSNSEATQLENK